ncbi:hypothetical protein, partial [Klebsiella pneumoniae]|uniref:hypothetical protein n=1 Tax=Klebsiella pneumoniae TaxID=573 RepID=UPI0025A2F7B3
IFGVKVLYIVFKKKQMTSQKVGTQEENEHRVSSLFPFIKRNGELRINVAPASTPDQGFEVFLIRMGGTNDTNTVTSIYRHPP